MRRDHFEMALYKCHLYVCIEEYAAVSGSKLDVKFNLICCSYNNWINMFYKYIQQQDDHYILDVRLLFIRHFRI